MRKVVLYSLLSADGVAESPDRFVLEFDEQMRENLRIVTETQDAVVLGRHTYDEWAGYWPTSDELPFAPFINNVDKYVLRSSTPQKQWNQSTVERRTPETLIAELKAQPGGDIGIHGSITLARHALAAGLVDELRLVVAPTLAGSGRRLLDNAGSRRQLELLSAEHTPSGALLLAYRTGSRL